MVSSKTLHVCLLGFTTLFSFADAAMRCMLSSPMLLDESEGELYLQQVKNTITGTYSMRLTFTGFNAWIGVGINTDGRSRMAPANAVIGKIRNNGDPAVDYYSLTSEATDASGVTPYGSSSIQNGSFEQPDEVTNILTFTQSLSEMGVDDNSMWIYAVGRSNNRWMGAHWVYGSFQISLTENCEEIPDPTASPTATPATPSPTDAAVAAESGTSTPTNPSPTTAPVAAAAPTSPPVPSSTTATTTTDSGSVLIDESTPGSFAQANSAESENLKVFESTKPYKNLWMVHGIFLAMAWGVCAPLGIAASILRNTLSERLGQSWYHIHFYFNMLTVVLTTAGFLIAVVAFSKEGEHHFVDNTHTRVGLAIMILVVFQALAGYFRPPAAASLNQSTSSNDAKQSNQFGTDGGSDEEWNANQNGGKTDKTEKTSAAAAAAVGGPEEKPLKRLVWEWSHRTGGILLLGLAWYNCHSGIQLQHQSWEDTKDWTSVFWGITGVISGTAFVLAYVLRWN